MLTGVLLFLALLVALLAIPVSMDYRLSWPDTDGRRVELQWAFGLVEVQLPTQNRKREPSQKKEADKKPERSSTGNGSGFKIIFVKAFRQRIARFIGDVWKSIRKENVEISVRAGFDDPADTGQLWAFAGPINAALAGVRQLSVNLEPDFIDQRFELSSRGFIQFTPLRILLLSLGLMLSPDIWQGIRKIRSGN